MDAPVLIPDDDLPDAATSMTSCPTIGNAGVSANVFGCHRGYLLPDSDRMQPSDAFQEYAKAVLKVQREREGRCAECGIQTYQTRRDAISGRVVSVGLTIDHQVLRGRCLLCHPLPSPHIYEPVMMEGEHQHPEVQVTNSTTSPSRNDYAKDVIECSSGKEQAAFCHALWIFSYDHDEEARNMLPSVYCAMQAFPRHARLQEAGCGVIQNWANEMNGNNTAMAIRLVVDAMLQHEAHSGVQQNGCLALVSMCASQGNYSAFFRLGGLAALEHAIQRFPQNRLIREAVSGLQGKLQVGSLGRGQ